MAFVDRAIYRVWQFWQTLNPGPLTPEAWEEIGKVLKPSEIQLFKSQTKSGQQHGCRVMKSLKDAGHEQSELLAAALLHDNGKYQVRSKLWDRPLVVLGGALLPTQAARWGNGDVEGWTRPFVVKAQHPHWGAEAAAAKGSALLTVTLIKRHQETLPAVSDSEEDSLLALLQWSDNIN